MRLPSLPSVGAPLAIVVGGAAVIVVALVYFLKSTTGKAVGTQTADAAVGMVTGVVGGLSGAVADVAKNEDINPLYGVGSSLGVGLYDLFHTGAAEKVINNAQKK